MPSSGARIVAASDHSTLVVFADEPGVELQGDILRLTRTLLGEAAPFVRNVHPGHASILVSFDPHMRSPAAMQAWLEERLQHLSDVDLPTPRTIEIPVCYGNDFGPDLNTVASMHELSEDEVVAIHSRALYRVDFLGFSPGFPYLAGLPPELATPRLAAPRTHVAAGSVAIGGTHTGVYPLASPGGWRLIGRTPLRLFRPEATPPSLLQMGDHVRFRPISPAEFATLAPRHDDPSAAIEPARSRTHADAPRKAQSSAEQAPNSVTVEKPGFLASTQDLGRFGAAHLGVSASGAADPLAFRLGNWLVGNVGDGTALELTLVGGTFVFHQETCIALTGSDFGALLEEAGASGSSRSLPPWRAIRVAAGSRLVLGHARDGARGYLCVAGGFEVPRFLGSASTHFQSGLGGLGRALQAGDRLYIASRGEPATIRHRTEDSGLRTLDMQWIAEQYAPGPLRITVGPQADWFTPDSQARLADSEYEVLEQSNRMGIRLAGPALARARSGELSSEGVSLGAIQVPESGQPILLFIEHQTTGGYPKIANVCSADVHRVGQLRPRDRVRCQWITLNAARALALEREAWLARWRDGGVS
ncbi:MAG TPA: 5-oxoprolinase subunit PxpB [Candidatus Krumholzibacteria bacterium]|nr:5-oxoprolinase subunit PxpB [Candidatus Krumholzibacteria bacterium]